MTRALLLASAALALGLAPASATVIPEGIQTQASAAISLSTESTLATTLVAAATGKAIYVTAFDFAFAGVGSFSLAYGTTAATPCDTGTTVLAGPWASGGYQTLAKGNGGAVLFIVPAGNALCAVMTGDGLTGGHPSSVGGSVSYSQF
ncbi:hypothetical protein DFR50_14238 [Roseiarcus fermentans]|uniref:Secreted protein n=1 Tax=Roseiarcus fermentans TaxID=1473586 RepID=A0A366EQ24_9HYPH|nr:hypothetical protein [Roseiarcus fermentans]RBP03790.1 hypothetical protein DFR50_14238 [Roseiarcus fermentans]